MPEPEEGSAIISLRRKRSINIQQLGRNLRKYQVPSTLVQQACQGKTIELVVPDWGSSADVRTQFGRQFHCLADWEVGKIVTKPAA